MADEKLKKRIQRCLNLLTLIMSQRGLNRKRFAEKFGCSVRTIADDIALLNDIGFGIRYESGEYVFSTKDVKFRSLPLNKDHILTLFIASQLMVLTPLEEQANEALSAMLLSLEEETRAFLRNLTDRIYIAPGGNIGETDTLVKLYQAVSECQAIRIRYQALSTHEEEIHDLHPYGVYIKDQERSYLRGYSFGAFQSLRWFKLCRITDVQFQRMRFTYPKDFSLRNDISQGFWAGDETYDVEIRFHPDVAQLVREREPKDRLTEMPGGGLLLRRTVRNADEIYYELLRYGHWAEVVRPQALRDKLKAEAEKMVKMYA